METLHDLSPLFVEPAASLRPTVAIIDLRALRQNLDFIRHQVPARAGIMAVVKADAYGHGMVPIARAALRWGVQALAVGTADEALTLRNTEGLESAPIVLMGPSMPEDAGALQEAGVSVAVGTMDLLHAHLRAARRLAAPARIHVKIDTGMGRYGFAHESTAWLEVISKEPDSFEGLFTHFSASDSAEPDDMRYTNLQRERFEAAMRRAGRAGLRPVMHAANSGAVLRHPLTHYELVRPGILIYGAEPSTTDLIGAPLHPVLRFQTKLMAVYRRRAGESISYGRTVTLRRDSLVGLIPVGYGDGYPRSLSNRADVLVAGQRCPVLGRVCMDQIMIDLTDVPMARPGDEVVLYGVQGEHRISLEEVAERAGTIPYELTCHLSRRVPRVYLDDAHLA